MKGQSKLGRLVTCPVCKAQPTTQCIKKQTDWEAPREFAKECHIERLVLALESLEDLVKVEPCECPDWVK